MGEDMDAETDAETREIRLTIANLLVAARYRHVPQQVTITYLRELQVLRQRLSELGGAKADQ